MHTGENAIFRYIRLVIPTGLEDVLQAWGRKNGVRAQFSLILEIIGI